MFDHTRKSSMREAYFKCCANEDVFLIYNMENNQLYRVNENGEIFYLKTIDNSKTVLNPRKLWHRLDTQYQPTESQGGPLANGLLQISGDCLYGSDNNLYYNIIHGKDAHNFQLYLWKTDDGWGFESNKGNFCLLNDLHLDNTFSDKMTKEEWVCEWGRTDIYNFMNDNRVSMSPANNYGGTPTSLTLDPDHFMGKSNNVWSMINNSPKTPNSPPPPPKGSKSNYLVDTTSDDNIIDNPMNIDYESSGSEWTNIDEDHDEESDSVSCYTEEEYDDVNEHEVHGGDDDVEDDDVEDDVEDDDDDSDWEPDGNEEEDEDEEEKIKTKLVYEYDYGYDPEYRYDEWCGDYFTKEEFYRYYGNDSVWKMMHPRKIYRRSIMSHTARQIHMWRPENFKTFMKMVRDSYY
jgi:hypothetical protein